jgi:hypothetical protein
MLVPLDRTRLVVVSSGGVDAVNKRDLSETDICDRFITPALHQAGWVHPALSQVLAPNASGDSHPHPLEIDLPPWILARGMALRRWLFSHGSAFRIEAPEALRQEQQGQALEVLALGQRRPGS